MGWQMHRTAQRIRAGQSERAARLTICGTDGKSDFDELHSGANDASVFLYGFDLIELDGEDLRPAALELRKRRLEKLLADGDGIRFSEHLEATARSSLRRNGQRG
jgi:bifunctional non-homologous end joining protein LigD